MVPIGLIKWVSGLLVLACSCLAKSHTSDFITMPAFGRKDCPIGALYVQATDECLPLKLWDATFIANYTILEWANREQYKLASGDSYRAAKDLFEMDADAMMNFMFGQFSMNGPASLFKQPANPSTQSCLMLWQRWTAVESLRINAFFEHSERMYQNAVETGATHVVIRVHYGGSFAMVFESNVRTDESSSERVRYWDLHSVCSSVLDMGKRPFDLSKRQKQIAESITVRYDGDVALPTPILSYKTANHTFRNLTQYFKQTFHIGEDGKPVSGGMPGNPMILAMAPLKDFMDGAMRMYRISDDVLNEAVDVVGRMDGILKQSSTKMADMDNYLKGAFPRLTREIQSFYNLITEFKQQTMRSIQVLLPKIRSGSEQEILLSELVSEVNRRLDLVDSDGWLGLKDQEAAQLRGLLDMLPQAVDLEENGACELTKRAQDWVLANGSDDDQTIAIVLDFPLNQFPMSMRDVVFDAVINETTMAEFKPRLLSLSSTTITRLKQIRSFVQANNREKASLDKPLLRSVFLDRQSFPLVNVPALNSALEFHFYSGGAVLCPAFNAPTAPTLTSVSLPAPNTTTPILSWSAVSSCPHPSMFTIQITANDNDYKTVEVPVEPTASLSNLAFTVDVADISQHGMGLGFRVRSESVAGFSEWSNQIFVVLQPTPAPIGRESDWQQKIE